jgi:pilus assembly protein Flp/PilA
MLMVFNHVFIRGDLFMKNLYQGFVNFLKDEEGVTAIEYGLLAALIAVAIIVAAALVGTRLTCIFNRVASCLISSTSGTCQTECT